MVIHPPDAEGGRRVHVGGAILGMAYSERDLREFLRRAGLPDWEDADLTDVRLFRWDGGGPQSWQA